MLHTPGILGFLGILALFFAFKSGGCGFLLMLLAFLFVLSVLRRASYGPRYGGYRGYRGYHQYNYPPRSYTPGYTYPPQNNPPAEDASQGNPYYANPEDAGEKTVRTGPNDDIVGHSEGSGTDTVRIDPPPGDSGEPTRRL